MTLRALFSFALDPLRETSFLAWCWIEDKTIDAWLSIRATFRNIYRWYRRSVIRRELAHIEYHIGHIQEQRRNDLHVERILQCRHLYLRSELQDL